MLNINDTLFSTGEWNSHVAAFPSPPITIPGWQSPHPDKRYGCSDSCCCNPRSDTCPSRRRFKSSNWRLSSPNGPTSHHASPQTTRNPLNRLRIWISSQVDFVEDMNILP